MCKRILGNNWRAKRRMQITVSWTPTEFQKSRSGNNFRWHRRAQSWQPEVSDDTEGDSFSTLAGMRTRLKRVEVLKSVKTGKIGIRTSF